MPEPENTSENSLESKRTLPPEMEPYKWQPGQSGNPGGRPKKKPITEMYERILANPEHLAAIEEATIKALTKGNMAMVLQLREVTERLEGKVSQGVEVSGELAILSLAERMQKARERASE